MNIAVFGANGRVGQKVVTKLLGSGHKVQALVYGKSNLPNHPNLTVVSGDVRDKSTVDKVLKESDAVVSALGSWGTKSKDILTSGMHTIIPAMQAQKIERIVSLTGADAWADGDNPKFINKASHFLLGITAPKILQDGEQHISLLKTSDLNWTVLRSPVMTSGGKISYHLTNSNPKPWQTINRSAVANAMAELALGNEYSRVSPFIHKAGG